MQKRQLTGSKYELYLKDKATLNDSASTMEELLK